MMHWRTSRRAVGGIDQLSGSPRGAGVGAELIPFPSGSYRASDQFFEPVQIPKSLFDIARFIGALVFLSGFGIGFFAFLFLLLITEFH